MPRPEFAQVVNTDHRLVVRTWHLAAFDLAEMAAVASPDESTIPARICEKCKAQMTHLSDLPSFLGRAAIRIFRCYVCNNVVSEDY
jgi:hypothetical protein